VGRLLPVIWKAIHPHYETRQIKEKLKMSDREEILKEQVLFHYAELENIVEQIQKISRDCLNERIRKRNNLRRLDPNDYYYTTQLAIVPQLDRKTGFLYVYLKKFPPKSNYGIRIKKKRGARKYPYKVIARQLKYFELDVFCKHYDRAYMLEIYANSVTKTIQGIKKQLDSISEQRTYWGNYRCKQIAEPSRHGSSSEDSELIDKLSFSL